MVENYIIADRNVYWIMERKVQLLNMIVFATFAIDYRFGGGDSTLHGHEN